MSFSEPDRQRMQTSRPGEGLVAEPPLSVLPPTSSSPEPGQENMRRLWYVGIGAAAVGLAVVGILLTTIPAVITPQTQQAVADYNPRKVLAPLAHHGDLNTCRNTLQQMNILLSRDASLRQTWIPENRAAVVATLALNDSDQADLNARDYTLLDGQYLESCLLFLDVAHVLNPNDTDSLAQTAPAAAGIRGLVTRAIAAAAFRTRALRQATAAFDWSVREVRLQPHPAFVTPPKFALRRGSGDEVERALVFLALLQQIGPRGTYTGSLIFKKEDGKETLWACGVLLAGDDRIFLFDPRIGMPVPGPNGIGVASLQDAVRDPTVLAQLTVDKRYPYDMTAERAAQVVVRQYCPLSALPPRVPQLERLLNESAVPVHLAQDSLAEKERLTAAVRQSLGDKAEILPWLLAKGDSGASVLRRFLPETEGGTDKPQANYIGLMGIYQIQMLPQTALPPPFNDGQRFPTTVGLGKRIWIRYIGYFVSPLIEPGKARDLMLRGDFAAAGPKLREDINTFDQRIERAAADPELRARVEKWVNQEAIPAYDQLVQLENLGNQADPEELAEAQQLANKAMANEDAHVLLDAGAAGNVLPELTYLQALCKHEEAEQWQARLASQHDRGQLPNNDDYEEAHTAWLAARSLWRDYLSRARPGGSLQRASCYRSFARAIVMSGDPPSPSAAASFILAGANAQPLHTAVSSIVLTAAEHSRLEKRVHEELSKALEELTALTDENLAPYAAYERIAILYRMNHAARE